MKIRTLLLMLAAVATPAAAADVRVSYLLDERALRAADASSPVRIGLYGDAACTAPAVETTLTLADVDVLVRVAATPLRGVPKAAKAVELRHTLRDVPPAAPLYARIDGNGVVPIGGACQVQTVGSPPHDSPMIVDGAGTVLGPYAVAADRGFPIWLRAFGDLTYGVAIEWGEIRGLADSLFFEAADCSSAPLVYADVYSLMMFFSSVSDGDVLYHPIAPPTQRVAHGSAYEVPTPADCASGTFVPPHHCCRAMTGAGFAADFLETGTTDITQYVPPFHVELR